MARFEDSQSVSSDSVVVYVEQSHFRARKSKMAAKIQDGGRKFLFLWTKKLRMVLENNHTKNGACCQSVTGISAIASTTCQCEVIANEFGSAVRVPRVFIMPVRAC